MNPVFRWWVNTRNSVDFALRSALTWSPPAHERAEEKDPPTTAETRWIVAYGLAEARNRMTQARWSRNQAVLEVLTAAAVPLADLLVRPTLRVLDIGSKNFDYVDALSGFLSRHGGSRTVVLTGLELDAHRRYTDLRTRRAWAEHYASFVPGARYVAGNLRNHTEKYHLITWFFPFVTEFPLLRWGLPLAEFQPLALLKHAISLLEPGGCLLLVNHQAAEAQLQRQLLGDLGLAYADLGAREKPVTLVLAGEPTTGRT